MITRFSKIDFRVILEYQIMSNVISYRVKMTQNEVNDTMNRLGAFIKDNGLTKSGCVTTTTFSVENVSGMQLMDIEILCPVDKACEVPQGFTFKTEFRLNNARKLRTTPFLGLCSKWE